MSAKNDIKTKKRDKSVHMIILLLLLLLISALVFGTMYFNVFDKGSDIVNLGKISFSMMSKKDSSDHKVNLEISLQGNDKVIKKADEKQMKRIITDAVSNSEYEKISGKDGMEYTRSIIKKELSSVLGEENLENVYISGFSTDIEDMPEDDNKVDRNDILKGMFKNMK